MTDAPRHVVIVVADSLRWDSVHAGGDHRLPYTTGHSVRFDQARAAGCWTLSSVASMFTGLLPHEHGATEQTRSVRAEVPTLAERLGALGYRTHIVTANNVTTDIFGLDRGFETVDRAWRIDPGSRRSVLRPLAVIAKPRLRRKLFSPDALRGRMTEDLHAGAVWFRSTMSTVLARALALLDDHRRRGERSFLFLNLVETHFPYHVADTFATSAPSPWGRLRELRSLYHLVNQTWLTRDATYIAPDMLALLRRRQRLAWERIAPGLDEFVRELRERHGALVILASDHGDNFGEQGWLYHFANVTDAGNRVPLFWVDPARDGARVETTPISVRDLFGAVLRAAGDRDPTLFSCVDEPGRSLSILQSYWYDNRNRTLAKYRFNQFAFVAGARRFAYRRGRWHAAPITRADEPEPEFRALDPGVDPLCEGVDEPARLAAVRRLFGDYLTFAATLPGSA